MTGRRRAGRAVARPPRRSASRGVLARARDDRGMAMVMVVMALMCSMALMVGMLGVLAGELRPTAYERKSERTIAAAQAGLQAGLAAVRQAWTSTTGTTLNGDLARLPCYPSSAPLVGQVGGLDASQDAVSYTVQVSYFLVNPAGQSAAWRSANALPCTPGAGTTTTPVYALVQAAGSTTMAAVPAGSGDRASEVVYTLNRTDQATLGGAVHSDLISSTTKDLCWEAATYPAVAGTRVLLATCVTGRPAQTWSYRTDYSIALAATQSTTYPPTGGLCIATDLTGATTSTSTVTTTPSPVTTTSTSTSTFTFTNGSGKVKTGTTTATTTGVTTPSPTTTTVTSTSGGTVVGASLQACSPGAWTQLWAYNDGGEFQGVNSAKTSLSSVCLTTGDSWVVGAQLTVAQCDYEKDNWTPDATVGAGAAGATTQQLINYGEYGRCLDVTNWNLSATWLINYPCKQDPTSSVGWNQRWVWDSAGTRQLVSNTSSGQYCLTTPVSAGAYVVVRACDAGRQDQRWTMLGDTGNRSTSYTIVDSWGRCLSLGAPGPGRPDLSSWSSITSDPCNGSYQQKWNAPPLPAGANLGSEREVTGGR